MSGANKRVLSETRRVGKECADCRPTKTCTFDLSAKRTCLSGINVGNNSISSNSTSSVMRRIGFASRGSLKSSRLSTKRSLNNTEDKVYHIASDTMNDKHCSSSKLATIGADNSKQRIDRCCTNSKTFKRDDSGYASDDDFESSVSDCEESSRHIKSVDYTDVELCDDSQCILTVETLDSPLPFKKKRVVADNSPQIIKDKELDEASLKGEKDQSDILIVNDKHVISRKSQPDEVDGNSSWAKNSLYSRVEETLIKFGRLDPPRDLLVLPWNRTQQPEQTSEIYIPHKYADQPLGDLFGAKLSTYLIERKDRSFYQHFFQDVKKDEPAEKMKIREDDELVLINGIFVPNLNHADVLNQFHSVKVDGKSRLTLVIRRVNKYDKKNKWEWIETSAVLAPDPHQMPKVTSPKCQKIDGEVEPARVKLKVPGSQLYLGIKQEVVFADVWTGIWSEDQTKIITKRTKVKANAESPDGLPYQYEAALCNEMRTSYIGIDEQDSVTLMREPLWFSMTEGAATVKFSFRNKFLGFNMKTGMLETKEYEYHFEKENYDGHDLDEPDGKTEMMVDTMCFESPRSVCLCTGRE